MNWNNMTLYIINAIILLQFTQLHIWRESNRKFMWKSTKWCKVIPVEYMKYLLLLV